MTPNLTKSLLEDFRTRCDEFVSHPHFRNLLDQRGLLCHLALEWFLEAHSAVRWPSWQHFVDQVPAIEAEYSREVIA